MLLRFAAAAACVLALVYSLSHAPVPGPTNASVIKSAIASLETDKPSGEMMLSLRVKHDLMPADEHETAATEPKRQDRFDSQAEQSEDSVLGRAGKAAKAAINAIQEFTSSPDDVALMDAGLDMRPAPVIRTALSREEICNALELAALEHKLPVEFLGRLIWQESRHKAEAVSRAGARGIAQFMPATASDMGLKDPFDPVAALLKSAQFLRMLHDRFGNVGLAAAAYNGGPGRLERWLETRVKNKKATLPQETQNYVRIITGKTVTEWVGVTGTQAAEVKAKNKVPCVPQQVIEAKAPTNTEKLEKPVQVADINEWNVQVIGAWSEQKAHEQFAAIKKKYPSMLGARRTSVFRGKLAKGGQATFIRIAAATQAEGNELCSKLKETGGSCAVMKNTIKTANKS